MKSITQKYTQSEALSTDIQHFYTHFQLSKIIRKANFHKLKGIPFKLLFCYLIQSMFSHQSIYRQHLQNKNQIPFTDKTYRNLLNDGRINWHRFLLELGHTVIAYFSRLTNEQRENVYIVDDSMYARENGKNVELTAFQYDHAKHKMIRGFRYLVLGWSDGNSFIPTDFSLLSGETKRVDPRQLDQRSHSGKRKMQAMCKATNVTIELLAAALKQGRHANNVLFDSWFSSPKMFRAIRELRLHAIAMVKRSSKVYYRYNNELLDVKTIFKKEKKRRGRSRYLLSVLVEAVYDDGKVVPIKLVYVRNRTKRKDYLVLASTDTTLTEDEIIRLYGKRWAIEVYFKMCKQYLHLAKYQGLSYDGIFAHTVLVATSYLFLAIRQREEIDDCTIGELFYLMVEELSDLTFIEALTELLSFLKMPSKRSPYFVKIV